MRFVLLCILPVLIILMLVWAVIENIFILMVSCFKIKTDIPTGFDKMRFVQLSDIHKRSFGKGNKRLIKKISAYNPEVIFLTGDMVSRDTVDFSEIKLLLTQLLRIAPVYYSLGNHETDLGETRLAELSMVIANSGAVLLNNASVTLVRNSSRLCIKGVTLDGACYKNKTGYSGLKALTAGDLGEKPDCFTVLLAHNPLFFDAYSQWGASLVLSGHIHGGAVRLPFVKGVLSPERKFFPKYSAGLYYKGSSVMLVSRGLGKLRLFNPPQIVVAELEASERS